METDFAIETRDLSKEFAGFRAVNGVNLRVRCNTVHALIGPNGAGKTTLFNLITRFLEPSAGEVRLRGMDVTRMDPARLARLGVGRSFQISAVFPSLSVIDNVRLALQRARGQGLAFWQSLAAFRERDARANELLALVGLDELAQSRAGELPYGRKRVLELATTLALDPSILLLDEPLAGMNHEDIESVGDLIRNIARDRTVLMVEHNLGVVARICDTITVMRRGEILAEGRYDEVSSDPEVIATYMGERHHAH